MNRVANERLPRHSGCSTPARCGWDPSSTRSPTVSLDFPAKSGQEWQSDITDADLAVVIRSLKRRGSRARLLAWKDAADWHPIASSDINAYVRERTGGDFTAKDFRTLHGTVAAAVSLARHGTEARKTARDRAISQAMRDAAEVLGNTPSIARKSYVDPRLIDRYSSGSTIDPARLGSAEAELRSLLFD
jgi:DNA topoisomerase-1